MKIRWLGNSCIEIFGRKHLVIDPNFKVPPEPGVDYVLVTHEHQDHFDLDCYKQIDARLIAPRTVLDEYGLDRIHNEGRDSQGNSCSILRGSKASVLPGSPACTTDANASESLVPSGTKERLFPGTEARAGEEIDGIKILESFCWKSKESYSYFIDGLLHSGDSARFPDVSGVKVVFTACFPNNFDDYISEFQRLKPGLVVPIHFDEEKKGNAIGLGERVKEAGIEFRLLEIGETLDV